MIAFYMLPANIEASYVEFYQTRHINIVVLDLYSKITLASARIVFNTKSQVSEKTALYVGQPISLLNQVNITNCPISLRYAISDRSHNPFYKELLQRQCDTSTQFHSDAENLWEIRKTIMLIDDMVGAVGAKKSDTDIDFAHLKSINQNSGQVKLEKHSIKSVRIKKLPL